MQWAFGFNLPTDAAIFIVTVVMFCYFLGVWLGYRWGLRVGKQEGRMNEES